jgi:serine/threonine protein kinase
VRRLSRYALLNRLASGDLSDLFLARLDNRLPGSDALEIGDACVLKLIRADVAGDLGFARQLLAEGSPAMRFIHESAVRVYDVDRIGSDLFVVMDLVHGQPLSNVLQRGAAAGKPLGQREVLWIAAELAAVLHAAHTRTAGGAMLHLGLSPRAAMITPEGRVRLLGLGGGRARVYLGPSTSRLPYASPEALGKKAPDRRADVFSLAVMLHDALTGRRLFRRASEGETRAAILEAPIPSVRAELYAVGDKLGAMVDKMLSRASETRPPMDEVETALREAAGSHASLEMPAAIARYLAAHFQEDLDAQQRVIDAAFRRVSRPAGAPGPSRVVTRDSAPARAPAPVEPRVVPDIPQLLPPDQLQKLSESEPDRATDPPGVTTDVSGSLRAPPPPEEGSATTDQTGALGERSSWGPPAASNGSAARGNGIRGSSPPHRTGDLTEQVPSSDLSAALKVHSKPPRSSVPPAGDRRRVARYELHAEPSGRISVVKARDPNVGRPISLKVLDTALPAESEELTVKAQITLLQREARLAGRLSHPALPVLYDAGRDGPFYFLTFEFVEGQLLSSLLAKTPRLDGSQVRLVLRDLVEALRYLHSVGVSHGDLRASNVMLGADGKARLIDLSLAAVENEPDHPLRPRNVQVASPEYLRGEPYGPSSDQFALGMLAYRMIAGEDPFPNRDPQALKSAIVSDLPRPPEAIVANVDSRLSEVAMRLLEKDPTLRFRDLSVLLDFLAEPQSRRTLPPAPAVARPSPGAPPAVPSRTRSERPEWLIVADGLEPDALHAILEAARIEAAVAGSVAEALDLLRECELIRTVVLSRDAIDDVAGFREELRRIAPAVELRVVPPLAARILGPELDPEALAVALADLLERTVSLRGRGERGAREEPWSIGRGVARRLALGLREELLIGIVLAARDMARRLRLSLGSEEISAIVPPEAASMFEAIDQVLGGPLEISRPRPSRSEQVAAVVEAFVEATRAQQSGQRASPRKAILELRRAADARRVDHDVVESLVDQLRELISALEIPPRAPPQRRILVSDVADGESVSRALEQAGYAVDQAADPEEAWSRLGASVFDAVVASNRPGQGGAVLLRLLRTDPRFKRMPLVVLAESVDDTLDEEIRPGFETEVVARSTLPGALLPSLKRMLHL